VTASNAYEARGRLLKTRKLILAAESFLSLAGVTDFAAPRLADVVAEWDGEVWTRLSLIADVTVCANAPRNGRVCPECVAAVVNDFRERPVIAAALARMGVQ
jgi:hypothetical protein